MDRRRFVLLVRLLRWGVVGARGGVVGGACGCSAGPARVMPADFTGLSYEMGQLYNAEYFSAKNNVAFRGLRM